MVDKSCSVRFVIYEKSFSSSWYRRGEHLCKWRFISPLQREMYVLCLLFLHCLQLKIILLPKWHLWGWHILIPFTSNSVMFSSSQVLICTWKGLDDIEIEGETNVERCLENHLLQANSEVTVPSIFLWCEQSIKKCLVMHSFMYLSDNFQF